MADFGLRYPDASILDIDLKLFALADQRPRLVDEPRTDHDVLPVDMRELDGVLRQIESDLLEALSVTPDAQSLHLFQLQREG